MGDVGPIDRFRNRIKSKWHIHEKQVYRMLGISLKAEVGARSLLSELIKKVGKRHDGDLKNPENCTGVHMSTHGDREEFPHDSLSEKSKGVPRWFTNKKMHLLSGIKDQLDIVRSVNGTRRGLDKSTSSRRKANWESWFWKDRSEEAKEFAKEDLPTILEDLSDTCDPKTTCKEEDLRELIRMSNMAPKSERQSRRSAPVVSPNPTIETRANKKRRTGDGQHSDQLLMPIDSPTNDSPGVALQMKRVPESVGSGKTDQRKQRNSQRRIFRQSLKT
uniref:Uncharacterized protein n=1 Tax=Grammatophora oceanica TaxID=210454 RepID=A0A7S1YGJ8_9STRA|mmetsp:Transcript_45807/g.68159  ORF Transcript_45807/g.68159 Transcript_45807/m.68159 type:complete len:275 (+) Transcript_45807:87-911(+)